MKFAIYTSAFACAMCSLVSGRKSGLKQSRELIYVNSRNNGIFWLDKKTMRAVDGKREIKLEWPYSYASYCHGTAIEM